MNWEDGAACATDPHPEHWFSRTLADVSRAVQVCHGCPVLARCAQAAVEQDEQHGVWAAVVRDSAVQASLGHQQRMADQAAQEAAERQERRRAMHAAKRGATARRPGGVRAVPGRGPGADAAPP